MADEQLRQIEKTKTKKSEKIIVQTPKEATKEKDKIENKKDVEEIKENEIKNVEKKEKTIVKALKKTESTVYGKNIPISLKHSVYIGKFIKGKKIDNAIIDLQEVIKKRRAIPMSGEMAHKRGAGMATGKYPFKASKNFIKLLKSLSANSINHGMDLEKTRIYTVIPNKSSKQMHRFGRTIFKKTDIKIIAKEVIK